MSLKVIDASAIQTGKTKDEIISGIRILYPDAMAIMPNGKVMSYYQAHMHPKEPLTLNDIPICVLNLDELDAEHIKHAIDSDENKQ
ncbi:MAG: hypothetical protein MRY32_09440 [Rickettsiales bacterium]|nr:hypothetical protein [Rickettsiales bacterium]